MDATTVAADLAKDVFEVALANRANRIIDRKRLTRRHFERFVESLPAGHRSRHGGLRNGPLRGRRCQASGLTVRLLPVQYVRPYVVICGLRREQGHPVPAGVRTVLARVIAILDDPACGLPTMLSRR